MPAGESEIVLPSREAQQRQAGRSFLNSLEPKRKHFRLSILKTEPAEIQGAKFSNPILALWVDSSNQSKLMSDLELKRVFYRSRQRMTVSRQQKQVLRSHTPEYFHRALVHAINGKDSITFNRCKSHFTRKKLNLLF